LLSEENLSCQQSDEYETAQLPFHRRAFLTLIPTPRSFGSCGTDRKCIFGERAEKATISGTLKGVLDPQPSAERAANPMDGEKRLESFPRSDENKRSGARLESGQRITGLGQQYGSSQEDRLTGHIAARLSQRRLVQEDLLRDQKQIASPMAGHDTTCIDDVPAVARLAARQQFLNKWYRPVALTPFVLVLIVNFWIFAKSNSWVFVAVGLASLLWAITIAGYGFYLMLSLHCPRCESKFGLGERCRSCDLPRHGNSSGSSQM
jgi:hypothetical protein